MGSVSDVISIIRLTATLDCEKGRDENGEPFLTILVRFAEKEKEPINNISLLCFTPHFSPNHSI